LADKKTSILHVLPF